jgi:CRISPR-associated exonuclease Cas4
MFAEEDCRPISALQHLLFCPRQCALIHVEQQWAENALTVTGRQLHEKVDRGRKQQRRGAPAVTRSLALRSLTLGLYGKADVVEFHDPSDPPATPPTFEATKPLPTGMAASAAMSSAPPQPTPFPVEYKRGKPKANRCDEVQLCAQALCLEEMLATPVPAGALFYGVTRRRTDVPFDAELRGITLDAIDRLHAMLGSGTTPPARREKKCDRCSLIDLCLPGVLEGREPASRYLSRSLTQLSAGTGPESEGAT